MPPRILVVDDNRDAAMTLAMTLQLLGGEVRTANDGLAAIDVAQEFKPSLILMDLAMPRLNGYEATKRIRLLPGFGEMRIIALTGWDQDGNQLSHSGDCFDGHLLKPIDLHVLKDLIQST